MGHQSSAKGGRRRGEIIHRSKLFGGVSTAEEVHARHGFRQPCGIAGCSNLPVIQVRMFMEHGEFVRRAPELAATIAASNPNGPYVPTTPMTFGHMVLFSKVSACRTHQRDLERSAAKAPSWVFVEVDRGPGADKPLVQSAGVPAAPGSLIVKA